MMAGFESYLWFIQALKEGRLRAQALQPDERMRRPGLSTLVLDEADLMLSMPGYEEDLQAVAPLVNDTSPLRNLQTFRLQYIGRHHREIRQHGPLRDKHVAGCASCIGNFEALG